jgi:hypothetical protein
MKDAIVIVAIILACWIAGSVVIAILFAPSLARRLKIMNPPYQPSDGRVARRENGDRG